jgi:hypothetical protein
MTDAAMADLDFDLLGAQRAGIELKRDEGLAWGGDGVGLEERAHDDGFVGDE